MDFTEYTDSNLKGLHKIQAFCRKNYIRKEMNKVKDYYEQIFNEIEGANSDTKVVWPEKTSSLCYPQFVRVNSDTAQQPRPQKTQTSKPVDDRTYDVVKDTANETTSSLVVRSSNPVIENTKVERDETRRTTLEIDHLKTLSKVELIGVRENVSLEMMWIHQAIQSRIQYLKLKRNLQKSKTNL